MADNRAVAYIEPGKVEVQEIDFPDFELKDGPDVHPDNVGRQCHHGVILKIVSTNICGSDQHMVRGFRLDDAPQGYEDFDSGVAQKFVLDPHGMLGDRKPLAA